MLNTCVIMGRLGQDPELKTTQSGVAVTSFSVAVQRDRKPQGGDYISDWIDCVAWRGTAEFICKYFGKGRMIALCGSLQTRTWEDKNGSKHKAVELVADKASFCGDKQEEREHQSPPAAFQQPIAPQSGFDDLEILSPDDLPF